MYAELLRGPFRQHGSRLFEIVAVHVLDRVAAPWGYTDIVLEHQGRQTPAIDEYNPRSDSLRIVLGLASERGGCDEDPFGSALPLKGTGEFLNLWAAHGGIPPLCLHVDRIETEAIFIDHAVDSAVARASDRSRGLCPIAAVPHSNE